MSHWETAGRSDEWFTPPEVFEALGETFDLDPAYPKRGPAFVPAVRIFCEEGLERQWVGFVWLNPPFGGRNSIAPWLAKFLDHGNGIALTPDRTSAPWFQNAWRRASTVLFTKKIRFIRPDGSRGVSPSNGTALWACNDRGDEALRRAEDAGFGILARAGLA